MAFPLPSPIPRNFNPYWVSSPGDLKILRKALIQGLFIEPNIIDEQAIQLAQIAQILSRSATNESTAYESGAVTTSATGTASLLTRQVERALTQVLGRAPGRGTDGFVQALNAAFPITGKGQVMFKPARSAVSLYANGNTTNGHSLSGQLSVEQANLYRQASIIVSDALNVLAGLTSFDPSADPDAVEALRALIQSQLNTLVDEFGRLDEPRRDRVNIYFSTLKQNLVQLGIAARLVIYGYGYGGDTITGGLNDNLVTAEDEAQVAAYELIKSYVATLEGIWQQYLSIGEAEAASGSYSERLSRVSVMLPVIADSNASLMAAMDSVGFTESERRSNAARFTDLGLDPLFELTFSRNYPQYFQYIENDQPRFLQVSLPDFTVNDFSEWIDRFASVEAPSVLATSGRFGLDFVTDQADTLFWVIGFVLDYVNNPANNARGQLLGKILAFDRVKQCLNELVFQLNSLANLSLSESRFTQR